MDDIICDDLMCINNPINAGKEFDPDGELAVCDKCFVQGIKDMSVDDLMEIHNILTTHLGNAKTIEDILALPFATDDIIDELMGYGTVEEVAEAVKDKWTDRFNVLLQYKISDDEE